MGKTVALTLSLLTFVLGPELSGAAIPRFGEGRDWFFEKRFGLFVHWGLYSIPAWHEQHQYRLRVPRREYEKLMHQFNPVRFDPDAWLDAAQNAGMRYVCFTTKHIDGFCLWDTAQTSYKITNTLNLAPSRTSVLLKPLKMRPKQAIVMNDGREIQTRVDLLPGDPKKGHEYLRLYDLPVDTFAGTVMVVRLELDEEP